MAGPTDFGVGFGIGLTRDIDISGAENAELQRRAAKAKAEEDGQKEQSKLAEEINKHLSTAKLGLHADVDPEFRYDVLAPAIASINEKMRSGQLTRADEQAFFLKLDQELPKYKRVSDMAFAVEKDLAAGNLPAGDYNTSFKGLGSGSFRNWEFDPILTGVRKQDQANEFSYNYTQNPKQDLLALGREAYKQPLSAATAFRNERSYTDPATGQTQRLPNNQTANVYYLTQPEKQQFFSQSIMAVPQNWRTWVRDQYADKKLTRDEAELLINNPQSLQSANQSDPLVRKVGKLASEWTENVASEDRRFSSPPSRNNININNTQPFNIGSGDENVFNFGIEKDEKGVGGFATVRPGPQIVSLSQPTNSRQDFASIPVQSYIITDDQNDGATGKLITNATNLDFTPSNVVWQGATKVPITIRVNGKDKTYPPGSVISEDVANLARQQGKKLPPNSLEWKPFAVGSAKIGDENRSVWITLDNITQSNMTNQFQQWGYDLPPMPTEDVYQYYGMQTTGAATKPTGQSASTNQPKKKKYNPATGQFE